MTCYFSETMDGRRDEEQSMFETSHVLGALLASSNLLHQSLSLCVHANTAGAFATGFTVELVNDIVYVAFSHVQPAASMNVGLNGGGFFDAVPIGSGGHGLFSPLDRGEDGEPVLVHACALQLFLGMINTPQFQMMVKEINNKKAAVILTGHSLGGSLASLTTLYLLCLLSRSIDPSPNPLLCITFGSPLLGNGALSQAVLRERWGDKFCHVVAQHDIVPRLLFCPPNSISIQLISHLLQPWQFSVQIPLSDQEMHELHQFVSMHTLAAATEQKPSDVPPCITGAFRPYGSYVMCSSEGAICTDNPIIIMRMLSLTFGTGYAGSSIAQEHLAYGDIVLRISERLLVKKKIGTGEEVPSSYYSSGISLALEASGIGNQDMVSMEAQECFKIPTIRMGRSPNLNGASLSISLAKITARRAQIEWYKALCDDDSGYYDSFKLRRASKRDSMVNMNRIKLAGFWDDVVDMLRGGRLPHDFHRRDKWVNAAHFYRLLVEPLDIAEHYRTGAHRSKGHYLAHGRAGRYELFEAWWREGRKDLNDGKRSKWAGLTQDSCFWARVEEAREWVEEARRETDAAKLASHVGKLNGFEGYAKSLVERKEVSRDVVAPGSSYSLWVGEWKDLKQVLDGSLQRVLDEKKEARNGIISIMS